MKAKKTEILTGPNARLTAERKAKYGRRDWLAWRDRNGVVHAAPRTPATVKAALLATGTQGFFSLVEAKSGIRTMVTWRMGCG